MGTHELHKASSCLLNGHKTGGTNQVREAGYRITHEEQTANQTTTAKMKKIKHIMLNSNLFIREVVVDDKRWMKHSDVLTKKNLSQERLNKLDAAEYRRKELVVKGGI